MLLEATTRGSIAHYVDALFWVYIILIFLYILLNMMFSLGLRPPYSSVWPGGFFRLIRSAHLRLRTCRGPTPRHSRPLHP